MLKKLCYTTILITVILFATFIPSTSEAQRNVSYQELAEKSMQQPLFFDFFSLPGDNDQSVTFVSTFSISYNFLPFKKLNQVQSDRQYFSTASLNMEVFRSKASNIGKEDVSVRGLQSVNRSTWRDTAYAENFEQTQSSARYLYGSLSVSLPPGVYSYLLQLNRADERDDRTSRTRTTRLNAYQNKKTGDILVAESVSEKQSPRRLTLLNIGNRVIYGEDFYAFAHIPQYDKSKTYSMVVERVNINNRDTTTIEEVYRQRIDPGQIHTGIKPVLTGNNRGKTEIDLRNDNGGSTYALMQVPNKKFPNAAYRLKINEQGSSLPAAVRIVQSIWFDMPTSLLNLNVAIDMLRFITDKKTIREINSGSRTERERKFREFWRKKDPTPDTEFNELMAEYYRRIDYAYKNFTTYNTVGYDSDQGQIYIRFGPPRNIQRRFPTDGSTREIWSYESREFIFRATSGFGDFKLVTER